MSGCSPSTVSSRDAAHFGDLARSSHQPSSDFKLNTLSFLLSSRDTFSECVFC